MGSRVLFVCKSNAGRSQMAEAFFNSISRSGHADSAGANVAAERRQGAPVDSRVVGVMAETGINLKGRVRKQVTPAMLEGADRVVVLMEHSEATLYVPEYVHASKKTEFWSIPDFADSDHAGFVAAREKIRGYVVELVQRTG